MAPMNLIDVNEQFKSDEQCLAYLESMRWPDGILTRPLRELRLHAVRDLNPITSPQTP